MPLAPASAPEPLEAAPVRPRAIESRVASIWITGAPRGRLAAPGEAAGLSGAGAPPPTVIGPPVDPAAPAGPPAATISPAETEGSEPGEVPLCTATVTPTVAEIGCVSTCAAGGSKPGSVRAVIKMASSNRYEPRRVARRVAAAKNARLRLIFLTAETHERTCVFSADAGNQPFRRLRPPTASAYLPASDHHLLGEFSPTCAVSPWFVTLEKGGAVYSGLTGEGVPPALRQARRGRRLRAVRREKRARPHRGWAHSLGTSRSRETGPSGRCTSTAGRFP